MNTIKQIPAKAMNRDEIMLLLRGFREKYDTQYRIRKIGIFGSAARNCMTDKSDIDVVVDLSRPDFLNLIGIKQAIEKQLHCPVDITR